MDKTAFTDSAPGQLVELMVDGNQDWAFIPAPLPNPGKYRQSYGRS